MPTSGKDKRPASGYVPFGAEGDAYFHRIVYIFNDNDYNVTACRNVLFIGIGWHRPRPRKEFGIGIFMGRRTFNENLKKCKALIVEKCRNICYFRKECKCS